MGRPGEGPPLEEEIRAAFAADEEFRPFAERAEKVRGVAEDFLQLIKSSFPNRYFILKKITQSQEFWEVCTQKSFVVLNDESYTKKLQSCFEISDNVFLFFVRVEQKQFLGYAKVVSEIRDLRDTPELQALVFPGNEKLWAFRIEWKSRLPVSFETVRFIRNSHNSNNSVNMCREFNEVDDLAAGMLAEVLERPEAAPNPRLNPFTPVVALETLQQS